MKKNKSCSVAAIRRHFPFSIIHFPLILALAGCEPKVGSEEWCAEMKEKPKGDWSANQAADFAQHCIFK